MLIFLVLIPYPLLKPTMAVADIIQYLDSLELIHHLTVVLILCSYIIMDLTSCVAHGQLVIEFQCQFFHFPSQNAQQFLLQRTRNPDIRIAGQENLAQDHMDPGPNQLAVLSDQPAPLPDQPASSLYHPVHFLNQTTSFPNQSTAPLLEQPAPLPDQPTTPFPDQPGAPLPDQPAPLQELTASLPEQSPPSPEHSTHLPDLSLLSVKRILLLVWKKVIQILLL